MEILQFLLSLLNNDKNPGDFNKLFELFKDNSFNLNEILKNVNLQTIMPILMNVFAAFKDNKSPTEPVGQSYKLEPIACIAGKDIIYSLNKYLSEC